MEPDTQIAGEASLDYKKIGAGRTPKFHEQEKALYRKFVKTRNVKSMVYQWMDIGCVRKCKSC